jgi:diguanylate cyclase (GGDEF)-like protein
MSNSINAYSVSDSGIVKDIAYKYSMILSYARAYEILEHHSQTLENLVNKRTNELKRANSEKQQLLDELTKKSLRLKQLSEHDYLTGLFNRRYFNQIISELNSTVDISIALIDLDHFKKVNDTYGHSIGDEVLIQVANTMKTVFSENVTIARYGGEEFVVLFDNVVFSRVNNLCELFRASVQSYNWNSIVPNLKLTVSLGVESSTTKQDIKSIIDQADQNLYKAKELGRNQIVISRDSITSKI